MKEKITFTEELAQKVIADNNLPLSIWHTESLYTLN